MINKQFTKTITIKNYVFLLHIDDDGQISFYRQTKVVDEWDFEESIHYETTTNDHVPFSKAVFKAVLSEIQTYIARFTPHYLYFVPSCARKATIYKRMVERSFMVINGLYSVVDEGERLHVYKC